MPLLPTVRILNLKFNKMEEEMNYLSQKIDKYESSITELEVLSAQHSYYNYSLQKLRKEKKLLENILNKLTEIELT